MKWENKCNLMFSLKDTIYILINYKLNSENIFQKIEKK